MAARPGVAKRWTWAALLLAAAPAGCGRPRAGGPGDMAPAPPGSGEAAYLAPPQASSALAAGGGLRVVGSAPPGSTVTLTSPEGEGVKATADRRGRWSVRLPASATPRLYAISALLGGRALHADGALVTAPGALVPAVTVRAGDAARPLSDARDTDIATVDYDPAGGIAVAGHAGPRASLTLVVDGMNVAVGQAGADGRYALLAANHSLPLGGHRLQVRAPDRRAEREVVLEPPSPLNAPYLASPAVGGGWRVEWALTGGGVQTTLILPP